MGDEGWAGRGESPATLGAVGIAMRTNRGACICLWVGGKKMLPVHCCELCLQFSGKLVPLQLTRNAAEAMLLADWYNVCGELEVAGASGACLRATRSFTLEQFN